MRIENQAWSRRGVLAGGATLLVAGAAAHARPVSATNTGTDAVIDAAVRDHGFQGVVMLGKAGKAGFARAIGLADAAAAVPITPHTPFGIASISKRLTSVAVMRLVERGRLALDAPIRMYLPDYRADIGARVTLQHLLSNSSGIPNLLSPAFRADSTLASQDLSTAEAIRRFASGDLAFDPGARFDYALTNWILVLGILESVTGMPYAEAMHRLVTAPLGLKSTATLPPPGSARSYRTMAPATEWISPRPAYVAAGGGFYSTADALIRFAHRVYDTDFLSRASRQALTTILVPSDSYALGGRIRQVPIGGRTVTAAWETGNTAGYRSVLGHRLDGGGTVVVLNNAGLSQRTMDEIAEAVLGKA